MKPDYRWRRWTYTFRAWIAEDGFSNGDREHEMYCDIIRNRPRCPHLRMWELNTRHGHLLIRTLHRRRYLHVRVGPWALKRGKT